MDPKDGLHIDTKTLFAPKKGKQATKGQRQIYDENRETIRNYTIAAIVTLLIQLIFSPPFSTTTSSLLALFAILVQAGSLGGMYFMAKPVLSGPSKTIVDGGIDLNLKGGFADYLVDIIITTALCSLLCVFSNKFWIAWLWLPCYFVYKFWMGVIAPWIFAPAPEPENQEVADKKKRKMERKMARAGYR